MLRYGVITIQVGLKGFIVYWLEPYKSGYNDDNKVLHEIEWQ
jgi:hypothetical protein